jgi:response regulator of citrate/malate metabolism
MNGLDTAKLIKEQNINSPKIIIMTGHEISEIKPDMVGIDNYLIKPFTINQLKNVIEEFQKKNDN